MPFESFSETIELNETFPCEWERWYKEWTKPTALYLKRRFSLSYEDAWDIAHDTWNDLFESINSGAVEIYKNPKGLYQQMAFYNGCNFVAIKANRVYKCELTDWNSPLIHMDPANGMELDQRLVEGLDLITSGQVDLYKDDLLLHCLKLLDSMGKHFKDKQDGEADRFIDDLAKEVCSLENGLKMEAVRRVVLENLVNWQRHVPEFVDEFCRFVLGICEQVPNAEDGNQIRQYIREGMGLKRSNIGTRLFRARERMSELVIKNNSRQTNASVHEILIGGAEPEVVQVEQDLDVEIEESDENLVGDEFWDEAIELVKTCELPKMKDLLRRKTPRRTYTSLRRSIMKKFAGHSASIGRVFRKEVLNYLTGKMLMICLLVANSVELKDENEVIDFFLDRQLERFISEEYIVATAEDIVNRGGFVSLGYDSRSVVEIFTKYA